ncbi:phospholipid carrier-dependent glycosyltransferase [Simiduia litorea]
MVPHSPLSLGALEKYSTKLLWLVLLLAAFLRFWHLGIIDHAYFDEVNIPQFGYAMLNGLRETPFITVHPPLPHYLFAGAIALYYQLPWVDGHASVAWSAIDPLSYRWLTALLGVSCCWFSAAIVKRLTGSGLMAVLAAFFVATDAVLVVDARAALNNIIMLAFGLASIWAFVKANDNDSGAYQWRWLVFSGALIGSTVAIKWNGLAFWLVPLALVFVHVLRFGVDQLRPVVGVQGLRYSGPSAMQVVVFLVFVPSLVYWLWWQPYLWLEGHWDFLEIHQRMRAFHTLEVGADDHPYCSAWYQWPYQGRPMSYLFAPIAGTQDVSVIHLLGNPVLYISSFLAVLLATGIWLRQCCQWLVSGVLAPSFWFLSLTCLGFWANFLPWVLVRRCLFSYHYEPASVFAFIALAWSFLSVGRLTLTSKLTRHAMTAVSLLLLLMIVIAWLYWLPLALGLPISLDGFYQRMWFSRWI